VAAPAGWYRDPDDQAMLRYWDGSQWTSDRQSTAETTATRSDNADISGIQVARLDGGSGSIDLRDEAVVLTWPDKWSLHSDRKAASPRTIPLSAIRDVEVIQKVTGNSLRVHLHGEPSDAKNVRECRVSP